MLVFKDRGNRCRVENQQTQPTFDAGSRNRTRATWVGGECSHHWATGTIKLISWEQLIDTVHTGLCYHFNNLTIRIFHEKFVNSNELTTYC